MDDHEIRRRLDELTERIRRIEEALDLDSTAEMPAIDEEPAQRQADAAPAADVDTNVSNRPAATQPSPPEESRPAPATPVPPAAPPPPTREPALAESIASPPAHKRRAAAARLLQGQSDRAAARIGREGIETFLGIKAAAVAGAIIVLLGAAFAIREYATGFWAAMPTWMQAMTVAAFGAALLAAGEVAFRRIGRAASVGLFSAGLGVLYLDAYATFQWFDPAVVSMNGAFALMGLTALIGFGITLRTRSLVIGVLSLLAGYGTPLLLAGGEANLLGLTVYLTMLLAIALGLSASLPAPFRALRSVAILGQGLLTTVALFAIGAGDWTIMLVAMSIWWAMFMAEAVFAALRNQSPVGNVLVCLAATSGYVVLGAMTMHVIGPLDRVWLGIFFAMVAALGMATAMHFGPGLDVLRGRLTTAMDKLAGALWGLGGVLIVAAIAFQFDSYGMTVSWLALALIAVELGRRLPARAVSVFGLLTGALAIARLVTFDALSTPLGEPLYSGEWLTITGWSLLALGAIAAIVIASFRVKDHGRVFWTIAPVMLTALAAVGWLIWCAVQLTDWTVTLGWLAGTAVLIAAREAGTRQRMLDIAMFMLLACAARWLVVDQAAARLDQAWDPMHMMPFANPGMLVAITILAAGAWLVRALQTDAPPTSRTRGGLISAEITGCIATVFFVLALSFQVDHWLARQVETGAAVAWSLEQWRALWLCGLWAAGGAAAAYVAVRRDLARLLVTGWAIMLLAAAAWLIYATTGFRLTESPAAVTAVLNLQVATGALIAAALLLAVRWTHHMARRVERGFPREGGAETIATALGAAALVALWIGSLEIDRFFVDQPMGRQMGWSVFWSLFGVALVLIGFRAPSAIARYAGLALLAITVGKVMLVDLAQVDQVWRVISFVVCGLLLLATSVLYARLAPRGIARPG